MSTCLFLRAHFLDAQLEDDIKGIYMTCRAMASRESADGNTALTRPFPLWLRDNRISARQITGIESEGITTTKKFPDMAVRALLCRVMEGDGCWW